MANQVYEGMFILDSSKYARDHAGVSGQVDKMIEKLGGELLVSRLWEERRLAYPIEGQRKGTYWLTYFRLPGEKVADLNRQCQLNDNVLRNLVLKVDERIVEALVAHANSGSTSGAHPGVDPEDAMTDDEKIAAAAAAAVAAGATSQPPSFDDDDSDDDDDGDDD
ncbi:MAG: 30S ribosomal protein S6 [Pirellulales bacterium]|nr:30S ribosomal protein S6 [Planctomycetales bacterium]